MAQRENQTAPSVPESLMPLHPAEERLLLFLRQLRFGTVQRLVIRDGLPEFAEEIHKVVKFK
jgi:hypothetical protein